MYDPATGNTYLDIQKSISLSRHPDIAKRDLPIPSLLTQIDDRVLESFVEEYNEVDHFELFDTKKNNLIPVEHLKDGGLGVPLNSLGLVIQRLYHQLYRFKNLASTATQTLNHHDWIEMMRRQVEERPVAKLKLGPARQTPRPRKQEDPGFSRASRHAPAKHKTRVRHFAGSLLDRTASEYSPSVDKRDSARAQAARPLFADRSAS